MRFYWERVESSRNFANKIWNASRFIMMNLEGKTVTEPADLNNLCFEDKWILSKLNTVIRDVTENMDKYELGIAVPVSYTHLDVYKRQMQDILIRFKRMQGYEALWQPGTDHAAIATEVKVIDKLKKEGIDKHDIGREEFLKHAWAWKEEYGGKIINQLKKLGASADWERERFTMDEGCSKAVQEVFIRLYEKGYIYKGSRIINWCPVWCTFFRKR